MKVYDPKGIMNKQPNIYVFECDNLWSLLRTTRASLYFAPQYNQLALSEE